MTRRALSLSVSIGLVLLATACSSSGGTTGSDAGTELACHSMAAHYDSIVADGFDGELDSKTADQLAQIIGYAQASNDAELRAAATEFQQDGSDKVAALARIATRCQGLGITEP